MITLSQARRTVLVVAALCAPSAMYADVLGQASTPNGSAFADACAGLGYSPDVQPGIAWAGNPSGGTTCFSAPGASVSKTASATGSARRPPPQTTPRWSTAPRAIRPPELLPFEAHHQSDQYQMTT